MKPIRKLAAIGSVAAGVCAVFALALGPETALAHDLKPAEGQALGLAVAPQSAECQAALKNLADWRVADRLEDMNEKLAKQEPGFAPATDVKEDADEKAKVMALWDAIRTACQPQAAAAVSAPPSDACVAARQALKEAISAQIAIEKAERANRTEGRTSDAAADKPEAVQLKALWDQKHAACGSPVQATKANFGASFGGWHHHSAGR
jgi:hypothetical protein